MPRLPPTLGDLAYEPGDDGQARSPAFGGVGPEVADLAVDWVGGVVVIVFPGCGLLVSISLFSKGVEEDLVG